jgi:hypothetical protein
MKKLAARDFEDLLQVKDTFENFTKMLIIVFLEKCAIPVFEGLFEEPHNKGIMKLLYRTAEWHALAKLRMHSDSTLTLLEDLTVEFGKLMCQFRDLTCSQFQTLELPRETAARYRRKTKQQVTAAQDSSSSMPAINISSLPPSITSETSSTSDYNPLQVQASRQRGLTYLPSSSIFWEIMSIIFVYLGQRTLFRHNWYVISQNLLQTNLPLF